MATSGPSPRRARTPYATTNMTTVVGKRWSSASWVASFHGHLVSDFYCGYNEYAGKHIVSLMVKSEDTD